MSNPLKPSGPLSAEKSALFALLLKKKQVAVARVPPIERVAGPGPFPLSYAQQRLWFLDRLEPGTPLYNIPLVMRFSGPLDDDALGRSLAEVVRRHEVLRSTFAAVDGVPMQFLSGDTDVPLPATDISRLPEAERVAQARRLAREEGQRPFDLGRGPLLRASLVKLGEEEHALLLTMHHIVTDGWSLGVLKREIRELYAAFAAGRPSPLAELPVQYADYARWQREWLAGGALDSQLSYWRERLAGAPAVLELPTDRPRPPVQSFRGGHESFALSRELTAGLRALGRGEGATPFMVLLAGFCLLLRRQTGQTDIVVGTPVAGRSRAEVEGLIGFFVNTLVLRASLSGDPSFAGLLRRVREVCLGAYAHQDVPFERLVEELQPERDLSHNPLFQVMFSFHSASAQEPRFTIKAEASQGVESGAAKFDLTLAVSETDGGLAASFEYNADLFEAETVRRLGERFERLLAGAAVNPNLSVDELPLLSEEEHRLAITGWNETAAAYPSRLCAHELFEAQAARTPDSVAVVCEGERLTYAELDERATRLAGRLVALGVGPDRRVGILLERSSRVLVALLGVLKAGGAYVPLEPGHPRERLSFMVRDAGVSVLLTQRTLAARLEAEHVICLDAAWPTAGEPPAAAPPPPVADNLAYVIYTSGSTGTPKGVMISHRGLVNYLVWCAEAYGAAGGRGAPVHSPLGFDLTVTSLLAPLTAGGRVLLVPESDGVTGLGDALGRERDLSLVKLTPAHLDLLSQQLGAGGAAGRARALIVGGDLLTAERLRFWREHAPDTRIVNEYGPTETVVGCCVYEVPGGPLPPGPVPIGRPIANTQMYVLDEKLRPLPTGVVGELYIGGAGVARGYVNRPSLTAEKFIPDPYGPEPGARLYKTGDLGRRLPDGHIEYLRRRDGQVKVRGFRIETGEVEAALLGHPAVKDALVLGRADRGGDKRLVAYVVADGPPRPKELREHLLGQLPEYMVPSAFVSLEALPLTPNGKVDRRALPAPEEAGGGIVDGYVAPRDVLELELCRVWEEVLGTGPVGVRDNFFELGGHSLRAVSLVERASTLTGKRVPVSAVFRAATVERLAALLREEAAPAPASPLVAIEPGDSRQPPLLFAHPAGGNVFRYVALARLLGPGQGFYGLQARGLDGGPGAHARVGEMAAHYVEAVRGLQPSGPYRLGGWSLGGLVAFEMARQLRAAGEEVALLALVDSYPQRPGCGGGEVERGGLFAPFIRHLGLSVDGLGGDAAEFRRLDAEARAAYVVERIMAAEEMYAQLGAERVRRLFEVFEIHTRAARAYEPAPYDGRVELFFAAEGDARAREEASAVWSGVTAGGADCRLVPGDHYTILERPNVEALAAALRARLRGADR